MRVKKKRWSLLFTCQSQWYLLWQEQLGKCGIASRVIYQNYFGCGLILCVTLRSCPCPLPIMMNVERLQPLHMAHFLLQHSPLARRQSAFPECSADLLRNSRADDTAALPSSWPVWATVSFIAVSVAPQTTRLQWHIWFFFYSLTLRLRYANCLWECRFLGGLWPRDRAAERVPFRYLWPLCVTCVSPGMSLAECACSVVTVTHMPTCGLQSHGLTEGCEYCRSSFIWPGFRVQLKRKHIYSLGFYVPASLLLLQSCLTCSLLEKLIESTTLFVSNIKSWLFGVFKRIHAGELLLEFGLKIGFAF